MITVHGGYLMGAPMGITEDDNGTIAIKPAGFLPAGFESPVDFGRMLSDWGADGQAPILAMSMGVDTFFIQQETVTLEDGIAHDCEVLSVPGGGWLAFSFVVDEGGTFNPGDEGVHPAVANNPPGSTVFNFLLPESEVDPEPEGSLASVGLTFEQLDLAETDIIHGLDMHLALLDTGLTGNGSSFFTGLLPQPDQTKVYFSLTPEFVDFVAGAGAWNGPSADLGMIYVSQFDGAQWSAPVEFQRVADIQDHEPIRGLALHTDGVVTEMLLSSRSVTDPLRQIEAVRFGDGNAPVRRPVAIKGPGGMGRHSLGKNIGAGLGIGDFCTRDPYFFVYGKHQSDAASPTGSLVLDDAVVARRMRLDLLDPAIRAGTLGIGSWSSPQLLPDPRLTYRLVPSRKQSPTAGSIVGGSTGPRRLLQLDKSVLRQAALPAPHAILKWPVKLKPRLVTNFPTISRSLSVSGYRHYRKVQDFYWPVMRACMNCRDWPSGESGTAWVTFHLIDSLRASPGLYCPGFIELPGFFPLEKQLDYYGGPVSVDCDFPPVSVLGDPATYFEGTRAIAAMWVVQCGARFFQAPLSVLRLV